MCVFMEIDLNHAVNEVENSVCIGCSNQSSSYVELWHACAGPLISLPKRGTVVVYFPQGHLEQFGFLEMPTFDLQPQIFCRVVNVQLLANMENDEVYTQVSLLPQPELVGMNLEGKEFEELVLDEEGGGGSPTKATPHMFCKTLTASDTSTHGGFSVPRRAAEDCFPPLDHKQQRPSQELVAKDLHGVEWRFRHIFRGQPRRHLLTTGWSLFVSQKNLVSGDAVLFLRGDDGELRLGIRRAVRPQNVLPNSIVGGLNSYPGALSTVANAISKKSVFHVFYSPRVNHAEFVISYQKYLRSVINPVCIGTRFKARLEMGDSPDRRCSGVVTGSGNMDPYRWPNSKWKCLMVKWDEDTTNNHQRRVSPWEIEPSVSLPPLNIQSSPRLKKPRTSLQSTPYDDPLMGGCGFSDYEESSRSSKVLQGQENAGSSARQIIKSTITENARVRSQSTTYPCFVAFDRFSSVLQGQESYPLSSLTERTDFKLGARGNPSFHCNSFSMYPKYYPQPLQNTMIRSDVNFLQSGITRDGNQKPDSSNELKLPENVPTTTLRAQNDESSGESVAGCKLFGFCLTGEEELLKAKGTLYCK